MPSAQSTTKGYIRANDWKKNDDLPEEVKECGRRVLFTNQPLLCHQGQSSNLLSFSLLLHSPACCYNHRVGILPSCCTFPGFNAILGCCFCVCVFLTFLYCVFDITLQFAKSNQPATAAASAQAAPVASPAAPGPAVKKEYDEARLQVGVLGTAGGGVVMGVWGCGWGADRWEDVFWCVCAYSLSLFLIPPYQSQVMCRWSILKLGLPISSLVCIAIMTKVCLLWQSLCVCHENICRNKSFVMTNIILLQQKTCFIMTSMCLLRQNFCHDKNDTCVSSCQW